MAKILISILALLALVSSTQFVPIPKEPYGLTVGDPNAKLQLTAYYDLLCPDSLDSDKILQNVFKTLSPVKAGIKITYMLYPLPYHIYAQKCAQGFQYIKTHHNTSIAEDYIHHTLENYDTWSEGNWSTKSINDFIIAFTAHNVQRYGVNSQGFSNALKAKSTEDGLVRAEWKYGNGVNSVSGTPIFYFNGVRIDQAGSWQYADWLDFFSQYVGTSRHAGVV